MPRASKGPSGTDVVRDHLMPALMRVGTEPPSRFRWLVSFAGRDLSAPDVIDSTRWELRAFCDSAFPTPPRPAKHIRKPPEQATLRELGLSASGLAEALGPLQPSLNDPDPREAVERLQRDAVLILDDFKTNDEFWPDFTIVRAVRLPNKRLVLVPGGNEEARFRGAICSVMLAVAERLVECPQPKCGRLFVREGKMQYCSTRCAQRAREQRFRAKHPDKVSNWKRDAYERKVRAKHPHAKIKRRPRTAR